MIKSKALYYGLKKLETPIKIEISYEWNDTNDELVDKLISKLPKFIEKQARRIKNERAKKIHHRTD